MRLQHQITFRKNSLLDSNCTGGNHIHVPQLPAQVTSLINQAKEGSLKTVATYVFPETAFPNFGQCLSKLCLSQLKCSFSSTKFLSKSHMPFFSSSFTIPVSSEHGLLLASELFWYMNINFCLSEVAL